MGNVGPKNMLGDIDADTPIYRTYSTRWFLDLLSTGYDGLRNPSSWEDPFENFFLSRTKVDFGSEIIPISNLAEDWYGQCWTLNSDTDAMWRIYSPNRDGVQVKTTVGKLFNNLCKLPVWSPSLQLFVGKVRYLSEGDIRTLMAKLTFLDVSSGGQGYPFAELLCIKREAFEHEQEVRIMYQYVNNSKGPAGSNGTVRYMLDANAVFDEILLDPRLTSPEVEALGAGLAKIGWKGLAPQSQLYNAPDFTIPST